MSPTQAMEQAYTLKNLALQNQQGQVALQEHQRTLAAQEALDQAFSGAKVNQDGSLDPSSIVTHLPGHLVPQVMQSITGINKSLTDLHESQLKVASTQADLVGGLANGVVSSGYDPKTFLQAIQTAKSAGLIPPDQAQQHALGAIEQGPAYIKQITDGYLAQSRDWQTTIAAKTRANAAATSAAKPTEATLAVGATSSDPEAAAQASAALAKMKQPGPPSEYQQQELALSRQRLALELRKQGFEESQGMNADDPKAQAAIDLLGTYMAQTGSMPQGFRVYGKNSAGFYTAVAADAAQKVQASGGSLASGAAGFKANTASLTQQQKMYDAASAFLKTADQNSALLEESLKKLPDIGSPLFNRPLRAFATNVQGDPNLSQFATYLTSVQNEYAKILTNPNLAGQLTDAARHETQQLINPAATVPQILASLKALRSEGTNRLNAIGQQINTIQGRVGGAGAPASGGAAGAPDLSGLAPGHGRTFNSGPFNGQTWTVGPDGKPAKVSG